MAKHAAGATYQPCAAHAGQAYHAAEARPCGAWFPFTAFPPHLVGVILLFCGLGLRVVARGFGVLPVQHFREALAHAQHVQVLALLEVFPRRRILEGGHRRAFRVGESYEGQAVLKRSLKSLPTGQIYDNAILGREAVRLVHGQRIARDNRALFRSLARAFLAAHFG